MKEYLLLRRLLCCILLLFELNCKTIGYASAKPTLPQEEVDAINVLLRLIPRELQIYDAKFSNSDCGVKFKYSLFCHCNETTCRVTSLHFGKLGITGQIPNAIGNLTSLAYLALEGNMFDKEIPSSFEKLSNLSTLILGNNLLGGPIPTFFGRMKSLKTLDLSDNFFNGSIPPVLGSLPSLRWLYLSNNLLSGPIPRELGKVSSLEELYLYSNQLSGPLPNDLGNLRNLQYIILSNNEFIGKLPTTFVELKNLLIFDINGNNFTGRIPEFIANWKNLEELVLVGNNFECPFPDAILSLKNLRALFLSDLTTDPEGEKPCLFPNISGMASLQLLTLRNCSLVGRIPEFIGKMPSLFYLDLSFNKLTGGIPTFGNHQELMKIYLRGNELNGSLPLWLTNLTDSYVDVSENLLKSLPTPPGNMSQNLNLFACCSHIENGNATWKKADYHCYNETPMYDQLHINCGGEGTTINETYYEADLQPYGGSTFFLSNNKSWGYSSMGSFIVVDDLYTVNRTCNISMTDAPLYTTARISPISLKYYGFCLRADLYTVKLHFAEIVFEENNKPTSRGKRVFDVQIQDKKVLSNFNIEEAAGGVNKNIIKEFIVPLNGSRLEIHLYWGGKGSFAVQQYYGPIISAISVSAVPKNTTDSMKSVRKLSTKSIAGIVVSALLFPISMLVCLWKLGWFGSKDLPEELKGIELSQGSFFNFRQIKDATQNFSSARKLGEGGFGSVYKGVLPDKTAIAVKQLSSKSKQGIREFANEIGTISALQHPNLVRLLGCCAEDDQLLLVYEFMENNSLHHALFGSEEIRVRLNWPTRVKICLGIAKGLAYLHEESKLKIVHRDIKPTNILLDKDLNAKISDFGFAKLYDGGMTHIITKIAGTTGYMAPEYAMRGHLTSKADVYSFGVVTLEIISGKNSANYRPNDGSDYLLDLAYVLQKKGNLIELIDPSLRSDYSLEEAITILDLAMVCTNPSPTLRPNMSEVVKILEGKSKITTSQVGALYSMDDFTMAKALAGLSQSTYPSSTSQEGASNANTSQAFSKEIKESGISADDCST